MSEPRVPDNLDTTVSYPEAAGWGVVTGRFVYGSPDGPDAKEYPDAAPIQGTMEVTASREIVTFRGDPPTTFYLKPVICKLSGNGFSSPAGKPYLVLIPTDRGGIAESGWNYTFTFRNKAGDLMHEVTTPVPQGEIVDLTLVLDTEPGAGPGVDPMVSMTSTLTLTAFTLTKKADEMEKMLDEARQSAAASAQSAKNSEDSAKTAESKIVEAAASAAASEEAAKAAEESSKASSASAKDAVDALNAGREENKTAIAAVKAENAATLEGVKVENTAALAQAQASLDAAKAEAASAAAKAAESAAQAGASAQDSATAKQAAQDAAVSSQESKQASEASAQSASESALSAQTAKDSAVQAAADVEKAKTLIATAPIEFKWDTIQESGVTKLRGSWRRTGEPDWRPVGDIKNGKDGTTPKITAGTVTFTEDGASKIETPEISPNRYQVNLWLPRAKGIDEKAVNKLLDTRLDKMRSALTPKFKDMFLFDYTVFGICRDGTAYSCGYGRDGLAGTGTEDFEIRYLREVLIDGTPCDIKISDGTMLALDTEGHIWGSGQLDQKLLPPQKNNMPVIYPIRVHPDKRFKSIKTKDHNAFAIDVDGKVWAWGRSYGYDPVQLPFAQPIKSISPDSDRSMFVLDINGKIWAFGNFLSNPREILSVPILPDLTFQRTENDQGSNMALDVDGNLWAWGQNAVGQLGVGNPSGYIENPIKVICDKPIADFSIVDQFFTVLTSDGEVRTCGSNFSGRLGNDSNTNINKRVPTRVDLKETATSIACGNNFVVARLANGRVATWGANYVGQLGRPAPREYDCYPAYLGEMTFVKIFARNNFAVAISEDGVAYAWGSNKYGQLGDGTTKDQYQPVLMSRI